jgi:uncharacterized protein
MQFKKLFDYSVPAVAATTIFSVVLIGLTLYATSVVYKIKLSSDTIEVTGSAKKAVTADTARLTVTLEAKIGVYDEAAAAAKLEAALGTIEAYLKKENLTEYELPVGNTFPNYTYPQNAEPILTGYTVNRSVVIRSTDVAKLKTLANDTKPFAGAGYTVSVSGLELTYSKLSEMRVALLTEAIADAKARAEAIATNSGRSVGQLRNAAGGVVQVLPADGVEISDYGTYDTTSMQKDVMVTVRTTFSLR